MISSKYFFEKIKDVKLEDYLSIFLMIGALILKPFYKKKYKNVWLICEDKNEARDNGYWFFKKVCENHSEQKCIYAINKKSIDFNKVKNIGEVVQYGSLQHWLIYFTCNCNISSQKGGKPNAPLCSFIELNGFYNAHNIFLQHGVTINNPKWLYADRSKFDIFITAAIPEYRYIKKNFGYCEEIIKLTGFPRFDNLHHQETHKNRILIMPTWRYWFNLKSKQNNNTDNNILNSEYLRKWKELLESEKLEQLIKRYNLEVIFYPHRNMQKFLKEFKYKLHSNVIVASWEDYDIQELMASSEMMITDYSSVFFDMVYMKKPIIFYQFDAEKYRKYQYEQGWFDYSNNPFGKSFSNEEDVIIKLEEIIKSNYQCNQQYIQAHKEYFKFYDENNSERIFNEIRKIL